MKFFIDGFARDSGYSVFMVIGFLKKTPQLCNDGNNATEWASLRFLEKLFIQGARATPVSSALREKVRLDPSDRCQDVLRRILSEVLLSFREFILLSMSIC